MSKDYCNLTKINLKKFVLKQHLDYLIKGHLRRKEMAL